MSCCFNISCDVVAGLSWACTTAGKYLCHLRSTARTLEQEMETLRTKRSDVEGEVETQIRHGLRCKDEVTGWMEMVDKLSIKEQKYQEDLRNRTTICFRDMALWLTDGVNDESNKFMSYAGKNLHEVPLKDEDWKQSKRISLSFSRIRELPAETVPTCPSLSTLLLNKNPDINKIPITFFSSLPALTVLDLYHTRIDIIPVDVGSLRELRYLNLEWTNIRSLPEALGNLTMLRFLNLSRTFELEEIPLDAISTLARLQALNMFCSGYEFLQESGHDIVKDGAGRQLSVMDLERLRRLDELGMTCRSLHLLQKVHSSHLLAKSVQYLQLENISGLTIEGITDCFRHMKNMKELWLSNCHELEGTLKIDGNCFPQNLRTLVLSNLPFLSGIHVVNSEQLSISFLSIYTCPNLNKLVGLEQIYTLKTFDLSYCSSIEEMISDVADAAEVASIVDQEFPCLQLLDLYELPALKCIPKHPLRFPSLTRLYVSDCPLLDKTPYERYLVHFM